MTSDCKEVERIAQDYAAHNSPSSRPARLARAYLALLAEPRLGPEQVAVLNRLMDRADRIGGDRDGMPECPWCKADGDGDWHAPDCDLVAARAALAAAKGGGDGK